MNTKVETALGVIGGSLGVLASAFIFYIVLAGIWPGGGSITYASPEDFGFMVVFGIVTLIVGLVGIAGGIIAKSDMKKGGKLMLISGILGFFLFFTFWWIIPGILLTAGGIMAMKDNRKEIS
ncbi:DUF4064 domain-containing protein [Methanococcoides sp. AM1]|uniref:DUF4064 domain-containing protein n=1 Tax=Methanococcoides sp. AM1 TaxID=1201011 RepID=UPI001082C7BA|nr:DUF4064 domain-containing protein [Methanococcoides sp. AM1]